MVLTQSTMAAILFFKRDKNNHKSLMVKSINFINLPKKEML